MDKLPRPFDKWNTYPGHVGIDYAEPNDTIVRASAFGIVTFSGWFSERAGYGVTVQHGNIELKYKHSDREDWRAPVNTKVMLGSSIMEIGKLGLGSTGYHLHHEVFVNGVIQTGDNYWKYIDISDNGYVGAPTSSGGENKPAIVKDDFMKLLYVKDNGDGNGKPAWWLLNTVTGKFKFIVNNGKPIEQERANTWAAVWGRATEVTRQEALNAIAAIKETQ